MRLHVVWSQAREHLRVEIVVMVTTTSTILEVRRRKLADGLTIDLRGIVEITPTGSEATGIDRHCREMIVILAEISTVEKVDLGNAQGVRYEMWVILDGNSIVRNRWAWMKLEGGLGRAGRNRWVGEEGEGEGEGMWSAVKEVVEDEEVMDEDDHPKIESTEERLTLTGALYQCPSRRVEHCLLHSQEKTSLGVISLRSLSRPKGSLRKMAARRIWHWMIRTTRSRLFRSSQRPRIPSCIQLVYQRPCLLRLNLLSIGSLKTMLFFRQRPIPARPSWRLLIENHSISPTRGAGSPLDRHSRTRRGASRIRST